MDDLQKYFQEYLRKYFGGKSLEGDYDRAYYQRAQEMLEKRRKQMQERVMERLASQGTLGAGVGSQALTEMVETPIAEAEAALDWQRLQAQQAEKLRRGEFAMGLAKERWQREEEARQRRSQLFGRLVGAGVSFIPGVGPAIGAAITGVTSAAATPATTPTTQTDFTQLYKMLYDQFLQQLQGGESLEPMGYDFPYPIYP